MNAQLNNIAFQIRNSFDNNLLKICIKFKWTKKNLAKTAPSNETIWDEFSKQHQALKKEPY